jgi:protease PrsW
MAQASGWEPGGRTVNLPTRQRQRRGVLAPVIGLVALGICGLVVLGLVGSSIGVAGVVVGALCALLPVGPVVATFLWVDRWEPEPPRLLLLAFLWGACFAALSALLINSSASLVVDQLLGRGRGDLIGTVAVAPVVEEALKGAFLVGMLIFRRREFDGIVDGIVYAGLVAAGFAFTENILYFGRAFTDNAAGASGGVVAVLVLRGLLSPFAHPLFTAMTGIAAGIAAPSRRVGVRILAVTIGYLVAVCLHALWNSSASLFGGGVFLGVYGFVMVPLFVAMIAVVVFQRKREQRIVTDQLPGFAQAGWIAPSEVTLLSSLAGRRGWRAAVRRRSGKAVARAVTEYQAAVTELAFLRDRMARGSVGASGPYWHEQALAELFRARMKAVGHPEALTVALRHHGPQSPWRPPPPGPLPAGPRRGPQPGVHQPGAYPSGGHPPAPPPGQPPQSWPGSAGPPRR